MSRIAKVAALVAVVVAVVAVGLWIWMRAALETPEPPVMMSVYVSAPPHRPSLPPDVRRRVFLDVNASPPAQVFSGLADTIGCTLELEPGVDRPVTLRVSNVTAATALDAVCESIGCQWHLVDTVLKVEASKPPPPISVGELVAQKLRAPLPAGIRFKGVPFADAVDAISRTAGVDFSVERVDPRTPVTVDVSEEQPIQALMKLIYAAGWSAGGTMVTAEKNGRLVVQFTPRGKLK